MADRRRNEVIQLSFLQRWRQLRKEQFKPDVLGKSLLKKFYMTRQMRLTVLRWVLYGLLCLLAVVLQAVLFSRLYLFDTRFDLPGALLLLIGVLEGTKNGSVFLLIASTLYYLTGSAPGPFCIAFLTVPGVLACLFRQKYLHRSPGSVILCAGVALMTYEMITFLLALFQGLTLWLRVNRAAITGLMSWALMLPLYPVTVRIGTIGGRPWKE